MSRRDLTSFRKTRLALAVAALSASLGACSTMPREEGPGGTIADAGRTTAETGSSLWDRTLYLLGFGGEHGGEGSEPQPTAVGERGLLDEVDLAMMQEDAVLPAPGAADVVRSSEWADTTVAGDDGSGDGTLLDGERVLVENRADGEPLPVSASPLTHEVGASETLWDIAKMTTGDATNWHVLADINDLEPDAAVYPGQTIVVPADLVRPELAGFTTTAEANAVASAGAGGEDDTLEGAGDEVAATEAERLAADVIAEVDAATGGTELRLAAGETLWDFAKRTTGDATNWRAIAEANGFSEEQATRVYENMRITVPTALLRDDEDGGSDVADAAASTPEPGTLVVEREALTPIADAEDAAEPDTLVEDVADAAENAAENAADALAPIADAADAAVEEVADAAAGAVDGAEDVLTAATETDEAGSETDPPIRIVEAAYRTEPDELVGDAEAEASAVVSEGGETGLPTEIMVSGTYYPKAVYNDADFSSSLLMRVSPGTTLQVSRALGSWYEVSTEQGTGYVHARDIK